MKLKLATYNILRGEKHKKIIQNIEKLASEGVSVFCLQEVINLGGGKSIIDDLLINLGNSWKTEKFLSEVPDSFDLGLCIVWDSSFLALNAADKLALPKVTKKDLVERIFQIIMTRYEFPIQRGALTLDFSCGGKNLRITNLHLNVSGGITHKLKQLNFMKDALAKKPAAAGEIICGDFNTLGWYRFTKNKNKKITNFLQKDFKHAFAKFTRTGPLYQVLDHIFVKNLTVIKTKVHRMGGSDHRPVVMEFEI